MYKTAKGSMYKMVKHHMNSLYKGKFRTNINNLHHKRTHNQNNNRSKKLQLLQHYLRGGWSFLQMYRGVLSLDRMEQMGCYK
jgi:DNA polymerase III delta prime subunit